MSFDPLERLEASMSDRSDVYVGEGWDAAEYYARLEEGLRNSICAPFPVSAVVVGHLGMEGVAPGFSDYKIDDRISGLCVAHDGNDWLVYQPEHDRFLLFWGSDLEALSAPGIWGSPLGCWSA